MTGGPGQGGLAGTRLSVGLCWVSLLFELLRCWDEGVRSCLVWIRTGLWLAAGAWLVLCLIPHARELFPLPGIPWKILWLLVAPAQQFLLAFPGKGGIQKGH